MLKDFILMFCCTNHLQNLHSDWKKKVLKKLLPILTIFYLHLVLPSRSFFHRSNCSWYLTICILIPFWILHALKATLLLRNSLTCTLLTPTEWATIPVVYTSSSFRYICFNAVVYKSCTTSWDIRYAGPVVKSGNTTRLYCWGDT